jgi:hypothetical protein
VKASNSYARTLISDSFFFIAYLSEFFLLALFHFLVFYWLFSFFGLILLHFISPFFFVLILSLFLAHMVSSLAYPNLLIIVVVMDLLMSGTHHYYIDVTSLPLTIRITHTIQMDHHNPTYV